jgi:tetratricopeptide (TPR) repeat protein
MVGWAAVLLALIAVAPAYAEWEQGVAAYNSKDFATAIKEFDEVTKTNPDFAGAYYMLGLSQRGGKQLSPAVANLRKAVELDGDNASYKVALGQALLDTKEYGEAYSLLKPLSLSSLDAKFRSSYALLFASAATNSGRPGDAIPVLTTQSRADAKNYRLFQALGVAQDAAGDDAKAFDAFKTACELNPKDQATCRSAIHSGIVTARRSTSDTQKDRIYGQTAQVADQLATSAPTFEHKLLAGEAWLGAKNYQKALGWFDQAQKTQPNNVLVHFYRSQCNTSINQLDSAIGNLQEALRIGADGKLRTQIYNQMGYVYDKQGNYMDAKRAYGEAGNQRKAAEMDTKQAAKEQNVQAQKEQDELRRTIKALEMQIKELEDIGEVDDANELQKQLDELKKHLQ